MAIKTLKNLYKGINPHLNSELQTPGSEEAGLSLWPGFHSAHVVDISNTLNTLLPTGYYAVTEQALQIRAEDIEAEFRSRSQKPQPDVALYATSARGIMTAVPMIEAEAPYDLLLDETLDLSEDFLTAIVIRDARQGDAVARIELLSPSNKPGHVGYEHYRQNRNHALYSKIPLIELDYLHESPPTVMKYPVYPGQNGSHAYNIFVSDPRPSVKQGHFKPYFFDVDESFPLVDIPLLGEEKLTFDFDAVYQQTYRTGRWGMRPFFVDYTLLPARFHTYSTDDQMRIRRRWKAIAEADARGDDLEQNEF
jgi:hypothetical protein